MKKTNVLLEIEQQYDVNSTKIESLYAWPFLRQPFYFRILQKKLGFNAHLRTKNKLQLLRNGLYGIRNIFRLRRFEYLFFNNADKRTLKIRGKQYDVFFDAWADKVGQEKSLFIEWAIEKHYSKKNTYSKFVIGDLVFKVGCFLYTVFYNKNAIEISSLEKVKEAYGLDLNVERLLKSKMGEVKCYQFLFRRVRPKAIFVISSFTKVSVVVAAHLENIKVYEAQHGYIGENHQFYNAYQNFGPTYYPDYLIAFGNREKEQIPENFIFKKEKIIPIGSFYLEHIRNTFNDDYLTKLKNQYSKLFCVTLQTIKEKELLQWIVEEARKNKTWLFILKPRHSNHLDYQEFTAIDNIILLPSYNIYQVLKYVDYNITIYSTTAVEAEAFGVKTLFYDIEGLSSKYFNPKRMFASLISHPGGTIGEEEIQYKSDVESYFEMNYSENVQNIVIT